MTKVKQVTAVRMAEAALSEATGVCQVVERREPCPARRVAVAEGWAKAVATAGVEQWSHC